MNRVCQQSQLGFALRFALSMIALMVVYSHLEPLLNYAYLWPLSLAAAQLLDFFGVPTVLYEYLDQGFCALQMENNLFHIKNECTGVFFLCVFVITVVVYTTSWSAKARGVVLGVLAFFTYSVVRVVVLAIVGDLAPSLLDFFHVYLMVTLNLGFLFYLWKYWVNRWGLRLSVST